MRSTPLCINNLSFTYDKGQHSLPVFSHLSLIVRANEFVSLIGPSGCGKSTLLQCISGLNEPQSGSILLHGLAKKNRKGTCGYMFQKPLLLRWKTVRENVMLNARLQSYDTHEATTQANALLQKAHLLNCANDYPATLSGGMAQRVAFLRTIFFHKDLLLMDEPFAALDSITRKKMQTWLQDILLMYHTSVLFVTHDISEALLLSDRIYVLSNRPANIVDEIIIPTPRPRTRDILLHSHFRKLVQRIEKILLI